jgi:hypothetical protein
MTEAAAKTIYQSKSLALSSVPRLPELATDCLLIGHGHKADVVWTRQQFRQICEHMLNGNDWHHFLTAYCRKTDGRACFAKAKRARVDRHADWAFDTIEGSAKNPAGIGFYARNAEGKSRWGALDFDAHDGDQKRARRLAFAAFQLLLTQPQLFLVLCTSGNNGWHLFVFTRDFFPVEDWMRLFRQAASVIGAEIRPGICEFFPSETRGEVGYAIRAPGTWNPKSGECGLIASETLAPLLVSLQQKESLSLSISVNSRSKKNEFTEWGKTALFRGNDGCWKDQFRIGVVSTRHERLCRLIDHIFRQVGRQTARKNAELQYREASVRLNASGIEHASEFDQYWEWKDAGWLGECSPAEKQKFNRLVSDNERDAFRIIKSFSRKAGEGKDFPIQCQSLADRLGITLKGASKMREKFRRLGILEQTASYVPNQSCARYHWTADPQSKRPPARSGS